MTPYDLTPTPPPFELLARASGVARRLHRRESDEVSRSDLEHLLFDLRVIQDECQPAILTRARARVAVLLARTPHDDWLREAELEGIDACLRAVAAEWDITPPR